MPALVAVAQDPSGKARPTALAYARGIGATLGRCAGDHVQGRDLRPISSSVSRSSSAGGLTELIMASYGTLVAAGYQPESAYFECLHEVKLIVDLIYEGGIVNMGASPSRTLRSTAT